MRKFAYSVSFILILSLFLNVFTYSAPVQKVNTCPGKPYPVSNFLTRGIQGVLLMNWSSARIAESQIEKQLKKVFNQGDLEIRIKPYSAMDLMAGKMKNLEIKGKNLSGEGIALTSIEAKSLCNFIYINYKKDPVEPLAPVYVSFKGTATEKDLNTILSSEQYQENLTKLKLKLNNSELDLMEFLNPKINIEGRKIFLSGNIHFIGTPKFISIPIKFGTGLKVKDNKLKLVDMQIFSSNSIRNAGPISDFVERMTLAVFDISSFGDENTEITLKNININNDKIDIDGTVWINSKK